MISNILFDINEKGQIDSALFLFVLTCMFDFEVTGTVNCYLIADN